MSEMIRDLFTDAESLRIYDLRKGWIQTGDSYKELSLVTPFFSYGGHRYKNVDELLGELKNEKEVIIFCSGGQGGYVLAMLLALGVNVVNVADNNPIRQGESIQEIEIISADELVKKYQDALIVIASYEHQDAIKNQLIEMGVRTDRLCYFDNGDKEQYFDSDIVEFTPDQAEVFVDGGCFNFGTSLKFLQHRGEGDSHVIAFEPDATNYERVLSCLETERKSREISADIINAGMWSTSTTLRFDGGKSEGSRLSEDGDITVDVKSIDDVMGDKKITLLKMDIEGAEMEALIGAREVILRDHPRLAICVYHKPQDMDEIAEYLHELVPDYKFYLRHYSLCNLETVLYAI